MIEGEEPKRRAKAVGSVFSLSDAPNSDDFVIDTKKLNRHLSRPFPTPVTQQDLNRPDGSALFASSDHNAQLLERFVRPGLPRNNNSLIHVEAGIKIHLLLEDLASVGLALPTMGAGGGQSLAGALSTSTHGSDVELPLLGDAVRAVHLVGPGGQEWWIEGSAGPGTPTEYSDLPDWCADTKIIRDSDFLHSIVVGLGRFGVIYSMILEVEPQYFLEEARHEATWSETRGALLAAVASGYTSAGNVFVDPRAGESLRFWQCLIDPASGSRAWITRRWRTSNTSLLNVDKKFDALGFLCTNPAWAVTIVVTATAAAVQLLTGLAVTVFNIYISIPFAGPVLATDYASAYLSLAVDIMAAALNYSTLGRFIATVMDLLNEFNADDPLFGDLVQDAIDTLITEIAGGILAAEHEPELRRGPSHLILDTHNYDLDHCYSVNSAEFFFDAGSTSYIQFVDDVLKTAQDLGPITGIVSLRFMRQTASKLGMQRFVRTVGIQVAPPRPGSTNDQYMQTVHALALAHGGIPHWGEEQDALFGASLVHKFYGDENLEAWRWALAETESVVDGFSWPSGEQPQSTEIPTTFSSKFTRSRGLERNAGLESYRRRRYVAAIVSGCG